MDVVYTLKLLATLCMALMLAFDIWNQVCLQSKALGYYVELQIVIVLGSTIQGTSINDNKITFHHHRPY